MRFRTTTAVPAAPLVAGAVGASPDPSQGPDGQIQVSEPQELSIPLAA